VEFEFSVFGGQVGVAAQRVPDRKALLPQRTAHRYQVQMVGREASNDSIGAMRGVLGLNG